MRIFPGLEVFTGFYLIAGLTTMEKRARNRRLIVLNDRIESAISHVNPSRDVYLRAR